GLVPEPTQSSQAPTFDVMSRGPSDHGSAVLDLAHTCKTGGRDRERTWGSLSPPANPDHFCFD
ncbi:hypothetical protein COCMIDRAFT_99079, partial [Bipolaris oryzae ATCC 44560]